MQIVERDLESLIPYARNARKLTDKQIDGIAASIKEFGYDAPIIVDGESVIIAGHGRYAALKKLGVKKVKVVVQAGLTKEQASARRILDNRQVESREYDTEMLKLELDELDLDWSQYAIDFADLIPPEPEATSEILEVDAPPLPEEPVTWPGDLWLLGEHRVLCGDSTKREDIERLMDGRQADLWLTDPPYNVEYVGKTKDALTIKNDSMDDEEFREFLVTVFGNAFWAMKPGASFYIWHADSEGFNFRGAVRDCEQQVRQCLVWKKNTLVMGRQDYHWKHEPCLYGWKKGAAHGWYTDRKQTTVLEFERPTVSEQHPTMKPEKLFAYQIGNSTAPQGLVFDNFLGSGTTIIAADQLGRKAYGLEIDPKYVDVIVQRWTKLTGKQAIHAETGKTFEETRAEREVR